VRTPVAHELALGLLEVDVGSRPRLVQALCTRRLFEVGYPARANDGVMLVLRSPLVPDLPSLALRVDDLVTVFEVDRAHLQPAPVELRQHAPWVVSLLDSSDGAEATQSMIQVLDPNALLALISRPAGACGCAGYRSRSAVNAAMPTAIVTIMLREASMTPIASALASSLTLFSVSDS
jgi:hypothetical protein